MEDIKANITKLFENIKKIKDENAITDNITVVAASKTVQPEIIDKLAENGIFFAGENRVQEFLQKYDKVNGIKWQFIGALQTNKVKYIIDKVCLIQSVDRKELLDEIQKQSAKRSICSDILIEVNIGGEVSKSGVSSNDLESLLRYASSLKNVKVKGLMSVLPKDAEDSLYIDMKMLYDLYSEKYLDFEFLSMGMTGDYQKAIKFGANMIRPGSAIFGQRIYLKG